MIVSVYSKRYGSYRIYLKGDSPHQTVMIVCELNWFSHISNHHNMYILMQSCDVFHTQHTIFFATLYTCAGTMWFGHHKVLHVLLYAHKIVLTSFWNIKLVILVVCVCVCVCVFLGSLCIIFLLRDDFESLKCWLDLWLSYMLDCIHICVFPFLKNGF